jgi:hypothetical protein
MSPESDEHQEHSAIGSSQLIGHYRRGLAFLLRISIVQYALLQQQPGKNSQSFLLVFL